MKLNSTYSKHVSGPNGVNKSTQRRIESQGNERTGHVDQTTSLQTCDFKTELVVFRYTNTQLYNADAQVCSHNDIERGNISS